MRRREREKRAEEKIAEATGEESEERKTFCVFYFSSPSVSLEETEEALRLVVPTLLKRLPAVCFEKDVARKCPRTGDVSFFRKLV